MNMRSCPKCGRNYYDGTNDFCLEDGSFLQHVQIPNIQEQETPTIVRPSLDELPTVFHSPQNLETEIPTIVHSSSVSPKTAVGIKDNVEAFFCYLPICGLGQLYALILIISRMRSSFVRFHAFQSIFLLITIVIGVFLWGFLGVIIFGDPKIASQKYPEQKEFFERIFQVYLLISFLTSMFFSCSSLLKKTIKIPILGKLAVYFSGLQEE